jgi:mannose/cellobiose epimerase-like protein (N-acyl-D-glucosamine 2-epimerase family)
MDRSLVEAHRALYSEALFSDVLPFWVKNSPDREKGGYFTCLDTAGNPFDTDKVSQSALCSLRRPLHSISVLVPHCLTLVWW